MSAAAGSLELLRAASRTPVPWKNGGGLTREVAIFPPGSDLETFEWRVSIAEIRGAGAFSRFPGVDRQMMIVSGRLSLAIDAASAITLTPESDALAFPGDVPVFAEPLGAPVTDLNLMTRRARCTATLTRRLAQPSAVLEPGAGTTLLVALAGLVVRRGAAELALDELDAVRTGGGGGCTITARSGASAFCLIEVL